MFFVIFVALQRTHVLGYASASMLAAVLQYFAPKTLETLQGSFTLKENADGVRGLYALNDVKKGETFLTVPYKLGVTLGDASAGSPVSFVGLLLKHYEDVIDAET